MSSLSGEEAADTPATELDVAPTSDIDIDEEGESESAESESSDDDESGTSVRSCSPASGSEWPFGRSDP